MTRNNIGTDPEKMMADENASNEKLLEQIAHLQAKLTEAEDVLQAIQDGQVDALVVSGGDDGDRIYTLKGADHTYRVLIETMNEGAVILFENGTILYCNSRFANMVQRSIESVMGGSMSDFVETAEEERFAGMLKRALTEDVREEINLHPENGQGVPVLLSMRSLLTAETASICIVVTDLTQQKQSEQKLTHYADTLQQKNQELGRRAEQLSRLSSELTLSEQRERRRLAKILHDHLQQLLVSARYGVEIFNQSSIPEYRESAQHVIDMLNESLETSRSLTVEFCPPILYDGGLVSGLEWLARWMKNKHGLKVDLRADPAAKPEGESLMILLFESVRELLLNVVKHGRIDSATVETARMDNECLKIIVSDHGAGFHVEDWRQNADPNSVGFGLFSIRERLTLLGGRFKLDSVPGKGTTITLTAPLAMGPTKAGGSEG